MKKKSKIRKRIIYFSASGLILITAGYLIWNYSTNYILRSISQSDSTNSRPLDEHSVASSADSPQAASNETRDDKSTQEISGKSGQEPNSNVVPQAPAKQEDQAKPPAVEPSAPVKSQTGQAKQLPSSNNNNFNYEAPVTPDKAKKVEESVTLSEKAQLTSILLKKLSPSELQLFIKMATNGITVEEKKEAKKVFLQKLSEDEYNQLISIAAKYGLSQGKNYKDSLNEK